MVPLRTAWATVLIALAGATALPSLAQATSFALGDHAPRLSAQSETGSKKPRKAKATKKSKSESESPKPSKRKASRKSEDRTVTFHDGSAESRSERERRLKRECKGRPNSGVCEGYTR